MAICKGVIRPSATVRDGYASCPGTNGRRYIDINSRPPADQEKTPKEKERRGRWSVQLVDANREEQSYFNNLVIKIADNKAKFAGLFKVKTIEYQDVLAFLI